MMEKNIEEEMNLPSASEIAFEKKLYNRMYIPENTSPQIPLISEILQRPIQKWREPLNRCPQNLFTFQLAQHRYVGRKLISSLKLAGKLKEMNCSRIISAMLLGYSQAVAHSSHHIDWFYYPLTAAEKLFVFNQLKHDHLIDIYHPFVFISNDHKERCSPVNGWSLNEKRADNLALGEANLRAYTLTWLKKEAPKNKIFYDPACSTGLFLYTLKKAFPTCRTIGQDISPTMIHYAKQFLDQHILGDARKPGVPDHYCDYIFIRFLNSEVVTREKAYEIFPFLLKKIKNDGKIILFGHTPVLLHIPYLASCYSLRVVRTLAWDSTEQVVFQYYILTKK